MIQDLKNKILINMKKENPYNIKAPSKFLQNFETQTELKRNILKEFLTEHELDNITKIVERIKKEGNIEYKGGKGWIIAKKRSEDQEQYWETKLKSIFGEDISCQFSFEGCCFDFINIKKNILFEAKLNIKDFSEEQYKRYIVAIGHYDFIYLIGRDMVIHIPKRTIYTEEDVDIFKLKQSMKKISERTKFDDVITDFEVINVKDVIEVL